jgi:hypothetical protein
VYDAAARPAGPNGWWTTSGDTPTRPGALLRLNWSGDDHEWVGTTLSFRFSAEDGGTRLEFRHHGLVPELECFAVCDRGWDFFLRRSGVAQAGRGGRPSRPGSPYRCAP